MKKSVITFFTLTILILLIGYLAYFINDNKSVYGNDKDSLVKVIKSIEGYENKSIEILEMKDFNDQRVVGFLSNHSPGYIHLEKNQDGNFEWNFIQVMDTETFSSFIPHNLPMFMFVTNNENKVSKIQVSVNGQTLEQTFIPYKATITWVDFPESDNSEYEFRNYIYFDKDGNLLKDIK